MSTEFQKTLLTKLSNLEAQVSSLKAHMETAGGDLKATEQAMRQASALMAECSRLLSEITESAEATDLASFKPRPIGGIVVRPVEIPASSYKPVGKYLAERAKEQGE